MACECIIQANEMGFYFAQNRLILACLSSRN